MMNWGDGVIITNFLSIVLEIIDLNRSRDLRWLLISFVLKSGLRILIRAPEVPFSVPPKKPKWPMFMFKAADWVFLEVSVVFIPHLYPFCWHLYYITQPLWEGETYPRHWSIDWDPWFLLGWRKAKPKRKKEGGPSCRLLLQSENLVMRPIIFICAPLVKSWLVKL